MKDNAVPARPLTNRAVSLLPNILTLCAVMCGFTAIRLSAEGQPQLAMAAIFAAVVLDVADGFAARRLSSVTAIGAELDSLADFLNFGVAPAILLYQTDLHLLGEAGWLIAGVYVLATCLRLARFNVRLKTFGEAADDRWFHGLPSTAAAVAILICDIAVNAAFKPGKASVLMAGAAIAGSALMLSKLRVPALFKRHAAGSRNRQ